MSNHEQNQKPENLDDNYTGPHEGDARDPRSLEDSMALTMAEIRERAEKPELYAARNRLIELRNKQARDPESVQMDELNDAISNAVVQEHLERERNKQRRAD